MIVNVGCAYSETIDVVDMLEGCCHSVLLPISIQSLSVTSQFDWVVTESQTNRWLSECILLQLQVTVWWLVWWSSVRDLEYGCFYCAVVLAATAAHLLWLPCCARKYVLSHTADSPFTFTLSLIEETSSTAGQCLMLPLLNFVDRVCQQIVMLSSVIMSTMMIVIAMCVLLSLSWGCCGLFDGDVVAAAEQDVSQTFD